MTIGERLLKYRKANNLSQEEVAEKLEVTRQTISKWETDQSTPDFDKLVPLCELFNITADELLTGKKSEIKYIDSQEKNKNTNISKALVTSICVFLYFIAICWIIMSEEVIHLNEGLIISIFLILCAIPTCILIYYFVSREKQNEKKLVFKNEKEENAVKKAIKNIISLLTTCIYLLISFWTMAWHITWLIWLIFAAVMSIVDLLFDLKGDHGE